MLRCTGVLTKKIRVLEWHTPRFRYCILKQQSFKICEKDLKMSMVMYILTDNGKRRYLQTVKIQ